MASFCIYGFLLALQIFNASALGPMKSNTKQKDGFNACLKFALCKCKDYEAWAECWDPLMPASKQEVLKTMRTTAVCGDIDTSKVGDDVKFMDMVAVLCNSPADKWEICYNNITGPLGTYVDEAAQAKDGPKKKENNVIEDARNCGLAAVGQRCAGMDINDCPQDY